jgi:putative transposase
MARKARSKIVVPGVPNHIIVRGNNRRRLFSFAGDYRAFLCLLQRSGEQHECAVHALCLMSNHVHDLVTPPTLEASSRYVARFAQRYAQLRNARRGGTGKLFEERFRSKPVVSAEQLVNTTLYIDANPVRAGLVDDALDYPWSTYAFHAGFAERSQIPRALWTPSAWYVSLGRSDGERARVYRELFDAYVAGASEPDDDVAPIERRSSERYTLRLTRPDGSRAFDGVVARLREKRK